MTGIPRSPPAPRTRRALAAALTTLFLAAASDAAADERADHAAAQKLALDGSRAMTDADYPRALARFQEAYARSPSAKLLLSVGDALRALGRNAEAAASYESYLRHPRAERARAAEVARSLQEIDALLGHLRLQISEPGAAIKLDGKDLDASISGAGASIRLDPGEHTVTATREGFAPALSTIRISSGEERALSLTLVSTRREPEKAVVRVVVARQRVAAYALGGLGAAGLAHGIAAGAVALVQKNAVRGHCFPGTLSCDQGGVDLARSAHTWATVSTGALVAGGALLGTGVALFFTAPSPPASTGASASVRLAVGASGGPAAIVEGAW